MCHTQQTTVKKPLPLQSELWHDSYSVVWNMTLIKEGIDTKLLLQSLYTAIMQFYKHFRKNNSFHEVHS